MRTPLLPTLAALLLFGRLLPSAARAETVVHDNDRIVFCGDSITGQGGNGGPTGWVGLVKEGLAIAHPAGRQTVAALGGSGATVGAWLNFDKKSREKPVFLDVKNLDVKATLDGGAEIVIIMLGMNDVLAPSLKDTPAAFDAWAAQYRVLAETLKARAHPRLLGFATITPCTEGLDAPKNRVEGELNARLIPLAKQENALLLPTHEAMAELLAAGRCYRPDFHITADFVHPNRAGHLAIAVGMLRGLGEKEAAARLLDKYSGFFRPPAADLPTLSYTLTAQPAPPDEAIRQFTIHYHWTPSASSAAEPVVTAAAPDGWKVAPPRLTGTAGDFQASGPLDRLVNKVTLSASWGGLEKQAEIDIPAGWRIAVGGSKGLGWDRTNSAYDPTQDRLPLDEELSKDEAFAKPAAFPLGDTPPWRHYTASIDFTGGAAPGSVDMAAVTFFQFHDLAYGARWIYSDKDRTVDLTLGTRAFAGTFSESVWLNADALYAGRLFKEPGRKFTVETRLHRGWNRLLFKSTFVQWQWEFTIDLAGKPGDDLADLRYAAKPPETSPPAKN